MGEHYVVRSSTFSQSEMFVVRDVYDREPRNWSFVDDAKPMPKLLRVDWLTPDGWISGVEGGHPPLYGPWALLPWFTEALTGARWTWDD